MWVGGRIAQDGWEKMRSQTSSSDNSLISEKHIESRKDSVNETKHIKNELIFRNKAAFDNWLKEINFKLGIPKHSRSAGTDDVRKDVAGTATYAKSVPHPNKKDQRVICAIDDQAPPELVDDKAQEKYGFTRVSFRQAEEIGFYTDSIDIIRQETKEFVINAPSTISDDYENEISQMITDDSGISFDLFVTLKPINENRNKYIVDMAGIADKNRLSIYMDKQNKLCFRMIDNERKSYVMSLGNKGTDKFMFLHCKYHQGAQYLSMHINKKEIGRFRLPKTTVFNFGSQRLTIGANLNGEYCAEWELNYLLMLMTNKGKHVVLNKIDPRNKDAVFLNNGRISQINSK